MLWNYILHKVSVCLPECNTCHHWGVSGYATSRPITEDSSRRSPTSYQENSSKTSGHLSWKEKRQRHIVFSWREGSCKKLSQRQTVDSWYHTREGGDEGVCCAGWIHGMEKTQWPNQSFWFGPGTGSWYSYVWTGGARTDRDWTWYIRKCSHGNTIHRHGSTCQAISSNGDTTYIES